MNNTCDIVQDLLPLYIDGICSDASRQMIEAHLKSCPACSDMCRQLNNSEIETQLKTEKEGVVQRQAKIFKRRSAFAGAIVAGILLIPILICLIVNLAQGAVMGWFFVVLVSLLLAASLIITPLMMPAHKALWTLGLSTAALMLLLGVCCIYTGGNWFLVAASAALFGLSVAFLPFVVNSRPLKNKLDGKKGLVCMAADTLLYFLMMVCIGFYVQKPDYPQLAFVISFCLVLPAWILFAVLRYLPVRKLFRAGICSMLLGFFGFAADMVLDAVSGGAAGWPKLHLFTWNYGTLEDNVKWLILLAGLFIGLLLILIGLLKGKKK